MAYLWVYTNNLLGLKTYHTNVNGNNREKLNVPLLVCICVPRHTIFATFSANQNYSKVNF